MGRTGKSNDLPSNVLPKKEDGAPKKLPPAIPEDDREDGDIATPKQDRYGDDDQPL
jgi:hypothetical protein